MDDQQIEIRTGSSGGRDRGRAVGLHPSVDHPFGVTSESHEGLVATVASNVAKVTLDLLDGSNLACELIPIDGSDARYLAIELDPGMHISALTAVDRHGIEVGRLDFAATLEAMEAQLGIESPMRRIR